jgi:hypothetical protein
MWLKVAKLLGVDTWVVILLLSLAGAAAISYTGYRLYAAGQESGRAEIQAKWDADKAEHATAYAALVEKTRRDEQAMNAKIAAAQQERDRAAQARAAAERRIDQLLRDRPARPATVSGEPPPPTAFQAGTFGTGAFLYREDGEFLRWEATRADLIRERLIECYSWHDAVMAQFGGSNEGQELDPVGSQVHRQEE